MQKVYIALFLVLTAVAVCFGGQASAAEKSLCGECEPCPKEVIICPKGTEPGYAYKCQCCKSCVIVDGGKCPWTGDKPSSGDVECEVETSCCNGVCTSDPCETTTTDSSTTTHKY